MIVNIDFVIRLLTMCRYHDYYIFNIKKKMNSIALNSFFSSNSMKDYLLILKYKKQMIIYDFFYNFVLKSIAKLSNDNYIKILTLFYLDGVNSEDISKLLNINICTFFRLKKKALVEFLQIINDTMPMVDIMNMYKSLWDSSNNN